MSKTPDFVIDLRSQPAPRTTPRMTIEEWLAKGHELFGESRRAFAFRCPRCGNVATPNDFSAAGADPQRAPYECIGRVTGARGGDYLPDGKRNPTPKAQPCDWAAFGLLGTLDSGIVVTSEDGESTVFSFAEPEPDSVPLPGVL